MARAVRSEWQANRNLSMGAAVPPRHYRRPAKRRPSMLDRMVPALSVGLLLGGAIALLLH